MKNKHFDLKLKATIKNEFIVTGVYPDFEWKDGKPTENIKGYKLRTICPTANYDETIVKIEGTMPPIQPEAVANNPAVVAFENLTFSSYFSSKTKKIEYVGQATGIKIIDG